MLPVTVEELAARLPGTLPELLGFEIVTLRPDFIEARMPVTPRHLAPNGYLHAASVVALADTACGMATIAHLPEGAENFTTIELKSNFIGTTRDGEILCDATPVHLGRATQVWDARVTDGPGGRNLALFRCTQMLLWPR